MIVILDSNIICQDFHMSGTSFRVFFDGLDAIPARLLVPEVVVDEVVNRYAEDLCESVRNVEKANAVLNRVAGVDIVKTPEIKCAAERSKYRGYLLKKLTDMGGEILAYPQVSHKDVVARDLSRKKPFTREGKGYRDYLIWETIRKQTYSGDKLVAFVSNDVSGFALDSAIDPELKSAVGPGTDLQLYTNLKEFNEIYVNPKLKMLEGVKAKLQENNLAGFNLRVWLKKELLGLIKNESYYELIIFSWPEGAADVWPTEIIKYSDVVVNSVQALKSGEKILRITVKAKVAFIVGVDWGQYESCRQIRNHLGDVEPFSTNLWRTIEDLECKISIILNSEESNPVSQNIDAIYGPGIGIEKQIKEQHFKSY